MLYIFAVCCCLSSIVYEKCHLCNDSVAKREEKKVKAFVEASEKPIAGRRMGGTSSDVLASAEFTRAEVTAGVVVTATLYLLV